METKSEAWREYCEAGDAIRLGDESPAAKARYESAELAYKAECANEPVEPSLPGWWNRPVARACFEADARDVER